MNKIVELDKIYVPCQDIVVRSIENEIIIIPITSGIGDNDDEIFSLNETGKAAWSRLCGNKNLKALIKELASDFGIPVKDIQKDVIGFIEELLRRKILKVKE